MQSKDAMHVLMRHADSPLKRRFEREQIQIMCALLPSLKFRCRIYLDRDVVFKLRLRDLSRVNL
jgi:hypothetical protein